MLQGSIQSKKDMAEIIIYSTYILQLHHRKNIFLKILHQRKNMVHDSDTHWYSDTLHNKN